jgi:hypothetical protein
MAQQEKNQYPLIVMLISVYVTCLWVVYDFGIMVSQTHGSPALIYATYDTDMKTSPLVKAF